ncbi:MAG: histone deacetylase family protein [Rhodospirillales bacterium]|nr:histone deacetylase family protein [Rhodospirillales bacterium]
MATLLYTHPACIDHNPGLYHPESPHRLKAVMGALERKDFASLDRREAPRADLAWIERVHDAFYAKQVLDAVPDAGQVHLDADTALSPASGEASLRASGAACAAVDAVVGGDGKTAFCAVRPPGHHAEPARAMGFCLFNSVAIAALHARVIHGLKRIAVVDFDVHHGNGTQAAFWSDPELFYASSHQWPAYPGSGMESERGVADNIVNVRLRPGSGSKEFRHAYRDTILPALGRFKPELLIVSAGFDAHARDPLAQLEVATEDYGWLTGELLNIANAHCKGRLVSSLEGGYDLEALAESAALHVRTLMEG